MKWLSLTILMFLVSHGLAQMDSLMVTQFDTAYTYLNSTLAQRDSIYLGLEVVRNSPHKIHIRRSTTGGFGQTVDLFSSDGISFQGILTQSIMEYVYVKSKEGGSSGPVRVYFKKSPMDSVDANELGRTIMQSGFVSMSEDSVNNNWSRRFFHCEGIMFQMKLDDQYQMFEFICPRGQPDSVPYKSLVIHMDSLFEQKLDFSNRYSREFIQSLPLGKTYSRTGYMHIYRFTEEERKWWEEDRPRREYLEFIKDTVDSYLQTELAKYDVDTNKCDCCYKFGLRYDLNGKLSAFEVHDHVKPKLEDGLSWFLEDWKYLRRCKREMKRIFRKISLKHFNLKHTVYRVVEPDYPDRSPWITDPNIY
ncbi:MAG: hypothetical protein AAGI38_03300 [Bacteroidota bacterium]